MQDPMGKPPKIPVGRSWGAVTCDAVGPKKKKMPCGGASRKRHGGDRGVTRARGTKGKDAPHKDPMSPKVAKG